MQAVQTNVFTRDDTFFGVCQAIGDDFGFSPQWLRIAFALAIFWNPFAAVAAYAGLGALVLATRWLVPNPQVKAEADVARESEPAAANEEELAIAA
jgi:phage shock protein PspC (stress-responsive transcriptional regulator)